MKSGYSRSKDIENNTVTYYKAYSYYPNLFSLENGSGINSTTVKKDGIQHTDINDLDLTINSDSYKQASNYLTVQPTMATLQMNSDYFGKAASVLSYTYSVWVSARYVQVDAYEATFGLYCVSTNLTNKNLFISNGNTNEDWGYLRPVVTIDGTVKINASESAGSSSGTPHSIEWDG